MKINKENLKPVIVLSAILFVVALLMAGVNMITAPIIEESEKAAVAESLNQVMEGGEFTEVTENYKNLPANVTAVYEEKNGKGYVITVSTSEGYTGQPIPVTVGIDKDGIITGIAVVNSPETKGTDTVASYFAGFAGKNLDDVVDAELVSGVTYSSTAVKNAALDAYRALSYDVPAAEDSTSVGEFGAWSVVGIVIAALAVGSAVTYVVIKRRKGI